MAPPPRAAPAPPAAKARALLKTQPGLELALRAAMPGAGLGTGEVRLGLDEQQHTWVQVTRGTPGEAEARCIALLLATRESLSKLPSRQWLQAELARSREALRALADSARAVPSDGACAEADSVVELQRCAEARVDQLSQGPAMECKQGLLCTIKRQLLSEEGQVAELSERYGPEHPTLRAALARHDAILSWFERQRRAEHEAMKSLLSRLARLSPAEAKRPHAAQKARLENALERLRHPAFEVRGGVADDLPLQLRLATLDLNSLALERSELLLRYAEKHPAVIAVEARLAALERRALRLVPTEIARLELASSTLERPLTRDDPRVRERQMQWERLLLLLEHEALSTPPELTIVRPCSVARSSPGHLLPQSLLCSVL